MEEGHRIEAEQTVVFWHKVDQDSRRDVRSKEEHYLQASRSLVEPSDLSFRRVWPPGEAKKSPFNVKLTRNIESGRLRLKERIFASLTE